MKELITQLIPYEIYLWIFTGCIIIGSVFYNIFEYFKMLIEEQHERRKLAALARENEIKTNIKQEEELPEEQIEVFINNDIEQKLLQHIDAELSPQAQIANKLEERERNNSGNDDSESIVSSVIETTEVIIQTTEVQPLAERGETTEVSQVSTTTTVEIYNTQTNLETINKQKSRFEVLKHEIENLKTRALRVDYEKKLVEATIHFPEEEYFNTLLGDRYIENRDFKKAQTIYKKLHFSNELDDKALYKLGFINLELGDTQAAEYLVGKAKELKPENPKYYQTLAEIKYNLEKIDECIELMEKAVDLRPTKFEYIEILGKLYKETNNIQLYYKTLLKMNALEPLNQRVKSELQKIQ